MGHLTFRILTASAIGFAAVCLNGARAKAFYFEGMPGSGQAQPRTLLPTPGPSSPVPVASDPLSPLPPPYSPPGSPPGNPTSPTSPGNPTTGPQTVPEPATGIAGLIGFGTLGVVRTLRRKKGR